MGVPRDAFLDTLNRQTTVVYSDTNIICIRVTNRGSGGGEGESCLHGLVSARQGVLFIASACDPEREGSRSKPIMGDWTP